MMLSIVAAFGGLDWALLGVIVLLLFFLIFLSMAEMGLSRMTKPKAAAMAEGGVKQGRALQQLVGEPGVGECLPDSSSHVDWRCCFSSIWSTWCGRWCFVKCHRIFCTR